MKKLVFTSAAILLLSVYSFGQGISGGIKAGLNLSNQKVSSDGISFDTKSKAGFHGGLT